jgi:hypothetical protein
VVGPADASLLSVAGRLGLAEKRLAAGAAQLCDIAIAGVRRLGSSFCDADEVARVEDLFNRHTKKCQSPADDAMMAPRVSG